MENVMKAMTQDRYGRLEEVLEVQDIELPVARDGEVRVRVGAASIHIGDCHGMRGVPYVMRPIFGLRRPKARVPGTDLAGTVEAIGAGVTRFQTGDEVFGWGTGTFAEYAVAAEDQLLAKPAELTFEQAAALGVSAITAFVAISEKGEVRPGQKVLVNGASGGVGTFAVQIAKALGAEVAGVCSARNQEMIRSIGADHAIDYAADDFTQGEARYDLILDNIGNHSFADTRRALAPGGTLLSNGAPVDGWFGGLDHVVVAMTQSIFVKQQGRPFVAFNTIERLRAVTEMVEAGKVTPVIDRTYPLAEGPQAIAHVVAGHAKGTVVITPEQPTP
jgi:NADPH:quinone reductase-like Zn-dependent oxidoreductase